MKAYIFQKKLATDLCALKLLGPHLIASTHTNPANKKNSSTILLSSKLPFLDSDFIHGEATLLSIYNYSNTVIQVLNSRFFC
jgi:hypothetical protein